MLRPSRECGLRRAGRLGAPGNVPPGCADGPRRRTRSDRDSPFSEGLHDAARDAKRVGRDRQTRIDAAGGRHEPAIDYEQVVHTGKPAPWVEHGAAGVVSEPAGADRVGIRVDRLPAPDHGARLPGDPTRLAVQRAPCAQVLRGILMEHSDDREPVAVGAAGVRSEEHTSELQSLAYLVCRLLLEKKKKKTSIGTKCIN